MWDFFHDLITDLEVYRFAEWLNFCKNHFFPISLTWRFWTSFYWVIPSSTHFSRHLFAGGIQQFREIQHCWRYTAIPCHNHFVFKIWLIWEVDSAIESNFLAIIFSSCLAYDSKWPKFLIWCFWGMFTLYVQFTTGCKPLFILYFFSNFRS